MLEKHTEVLESVAIRFAGDSGDGMQLTGTQFTETTALAVNYLTTFPDDPGTLTVRLTADLGSPVSRPTSFKRRS